MKIPKTIGNASGIAIAPIDASATTRIGGVSISRFAGLVVSKKGKPFEILPINTDNMLSVLGDPYHPTDSWNSEPMRHLNDAVQASDGFVVRVVANDAMYPYIIATDTTPPYGSLSSEAGQSLVSEQGVQLVEEHVRALEWTQGAIAYGSLPPVGVNEYFTVFPDDGDPSGNRSIQLGAPDPENNDVVFTIYETDHLGTETVLESHVVNFNPEAVDDFGDSKYIIDVFDSLSAFSIILGDLDATGVDLSAPTAASFDGGTNGTPANLDDTQLELGAAVIAAHDEFYSAVLGMGFYDADGNPIPASMHQITDDRLIDGFFDFNPRLSYADALTQAETSPINLAGVSLYHFPYEANDPFFTQSRNTWGLSGMAYRAKVAGVNMGTGLVGGWHYSPAGETRATITRTSMKLRANAGVPDYEAMYPVRLNKVDRGSSGVLMIDDSLSSYLGENYLRFQHVNSTMNAISRDFIDLANQIKHQPDGITEDTLTIGLETIFQSYVSSGALVTPRTPEGGDSPYQYTIKQLDIDLWEVSWAVCVTGTARRIVGRPSLIR